MENLSVLPEMRHDLRSLDYETHPLTTLPAQVVVIGAENPVGAAVLRLLAQRGANAFGLSLTLPAARQETREGGSIRFLDLRTPGHLESLAETLDGATVMDCSSLSASASESSSFDSLLSIPDRLLRLKSVQVYVQALAAPALRAQQPLWEIGARAASELILASSRGRMGAVQVRLPAVYSGDDQWPPMSRLLSFAPQAVSWPLALIHVDDAAAALIHAASQATDSAGATFTVAGTDIGSTEELQALLSQPLPAVRAPSHSPTPLLARRTDSMPQPINQAIAPKLGQADAPKALDRHWSISAVTLCYHENQTIPFMYERLTNVFQKIGVDYEIIFVNNDNAPEDAANLIQELSARDSHVRGVSLTRNFHPQAGYRSGIELATKNAVVLLDGDLQDPPELIEAFLEKWKQGYEVVYGRRVKREAPLYMQWSYKLFYRIFARFSYIQIPHDAGDFSLLDRRVVDCILEFPERDLFLRGLRAYVGFRQTGIDYVRPERMFGKSTNNLARLIGWAKTGIVSFSNAPLGLISYMGTALLFLAVLLGLAQIAARLLFPGLTPQGLTTVLLSILFFGSLNMFALGVIGEYIAKIFEEVKQRPRYIRRSVIANGEVQEKVHMDRPPARRQEN